ncbi:hypothetical protein N7519_003719 [Penicillium mononematosum]|nr:uncharacterized protein N7519_003719 [Penicillium mononematosum]KAJ6188811.1 hypothetical protein N7519_003719 [Penicillium mononematosum]
MTPLYSMVFAFFVHDTVRDGREPQVMDPKPSLLEHF